MRPNNRLMFRQRDAYIEVVSNQPDYVRIDEHGALRVGGGRVSLDSVLAAWSQGHSPETIRSQYPALSLEEIYGAIAWSLANRAEVEVYLKKQDALWEQWRKRSELDNGSLLARLRAAKHPAGTR